MDEKDELLATMGYHTGLCGLLIGMDKAGRERTIGNIGQNKEPQLIFAEGDQGPVTSITLEPRLLFALANSDKFRQLIEEEILKCEEAALAAGLDIKLDPKDLARTPPGDTDPQP